MGGSTPGPGTSSLASARAGMSPKAFVFTETLALPRTRAHPIRLVLFLIALVVLVGVAISILNQPATCGGQVMRSGDRCVNLKTGASATSAEVAGAPIQQWWFWVLVIGLVLAAGLWLIVIPTFRRDPHLLAANGQTVSRLLDGLDHQIAATQGNPVQERLIEYRAAYLARMQSLKGRKVPVEVVERYEQGWV